MYQSNSTYVHYHPTESIPNDHWAITYDPKYTVALIQLIQSSHGVIIKLNPTDRRGYRCILQLYHTDMKSTLNREWTSQEMNSVFAAGTLLCGFYSSLGLLPQIYLAANNAMEHIKHDNNQEYLLAGRKEPLILHIHILGRGMPSHCYIPNIPLSSPPIGDEFILKGINNNNNNTNTKEEEHQSKIEWTDRERIDAITLIRQYLDQHSNEFNYIDINNNK